MLSCIRNCLLLLVRNTCLLIIFLFLISTPALSQVSVNPNVKILDDLIVENRGKLRRLCELTDNWVDKLTVYHEDAFFAERQVKNATKALIHLKSRKIYITTNVLYAEFVDKSKRTEVLKALNKRYDFLKTFSDDWTQVFSKAEAHRQDMLDHVVRKRIIEKQLAALIKERNKITRSTETINIPEKTPGDGSDEEIRERVWERNMWDSIRKQNELASILDSANNETTTTADIFNDLTGLFPDSTRLQFAEDIITQAPPALKDISAYYGNEVEKLKVDLEAEAKKLREAAETPPAIEPTPQVTPSTKVVRVPNTDQSPDNTGGETPGGNSQVSVVSQPLIHLDTNYRLWKTPDINFQTSDFVSGTPNTIELAPDHLGGFGGKIEAEIPLDFYVQDTWGTGSRLTMNVGVDFNEYSGDRQTVFQQPAGTQQVVGGIGRTGTPFGLNTNTVFNTSVDGHAIGGKIGFKQTMPMNGYSFFVGPNVTVKHRSTDVDIAYTTGNGGAQMFNSFLNFDTKETIIRPTITVGGSSHYVLIPGTDVKFRLNGELEAGPSLHFGDSNYLDCGSTDGTGGPCNGGFFQTSASNTSSDIGFYAAATAGLTVAVTDNFKLEASGQVVVEPFYQQDLNNNIATTPGNVVSFGGVSQSLRSRLGVGGNLRAIISF